MSTASVPNTFSACTGITSAGTPTNHGPAPEHKPRGVCRPCILVSMIIEFEPPRFPDDPDEITDVQAVEEMARVRNYRQTRNINFPRFVRALNNAGYKITVAEYKLCETRPANCPVHVREGMLTYAYKVLNQTRVTGSVQDECTARAMQVIREYRVREGLTFLDIAEFLTEECGLRFSEAEYRTCEQGITKIVPFGVIAHVGAYLRIPPAEMHPTW